MKEAERLFEARGYIQAVLWALEGNQPARRFYEAMGFALDGAAKEVKLGTAMTVVRYKKELDRRS